MSSIICSLFVIKSLTIAQSISFGQQISTGQSSTISKSSRDLADYDKWASPNPSKPTDVFIRVQLRNVNSVDMAQELFDVDMSIQMSWRDDRLNNKNIRFIELDSIWNPDIHITNAVSDPFSDGSPSIMCEIWTDDLIKAEDKKYGRNDRRNVYCFPQLNIISKFTSKPNSFPYDIQEPYLIFKSRAYSNDFVRLNMSINNLIHELPAEADDLNYVDSNLTLFEHDLFETNNEWSLVSYAYHMDEYTDDMITETLTKLRLDMCFVRNVTYLHLTLYIPIFLLVVLTLVGNLIPDSEQAMNFQITLLLTSFVYLDVITQQIPAVQNFYDAPMILLFFVIILVLQVVLIVVELIQMRIEKYSRKWIVRLAVCCTKNNRITPTPPKTPDPYDSELSNKKSEEEEEELVQKFSYVFDWVMFSLVLGVVIAAAGATLVDALTSRNKQLESLNTH